MKRRGGFSVIEVLFGITLGLMIWAIVMTMMRAEARMRENIDGRTNADAIPAALHRHLSRDLARTPLVSGAEAVKLTDGGRVLELAVQIAPARVDGRRLDLPVRTVRYRMSGVGVVVREDAGRRDLIPAEGLKTLSFVREPAREAGAQDLLRVGGEVEGNGVMAATAFSLAFPVGARRPGSVRWARVLRDRDAGVMVP
jgi:hypothetical protein